MSRDKGLAGEVLSGDTHFTTLKKFEENLERQRATNYDVYQELQKKIHQKGSPADELTLFIEQRDKAFFQHMLAVKWHRSNVHYLREFEQIAALSSSDGSTSLNTALEDDSKITKEYIDNITRFIEERENISGLISKLESTKRTIESQMATLVVTTISSFIFDPFSIGTKKKIPDLQNQLQATEDKITTLREKFQQTWQKDFNEYQTITREELQSLTKRYNLYQTLSIDLNNMEATIAAYPNQTLGNRYAQFKQDRSQYNLIRFCEQAIQCGYNETLSRGENPLANIIPTLQKLYPNLSKDLQKLSTTLTTNLKNRDELKKLLAQMLQKNKDIEDESKKSKLFISELKNKIANLSTLTLMSSLIGRGEKEDLEKQLASERDSLKKLKLTFDKREHLINNLNRFLDNKSGSNLYILYRHAQQDRKIFEDSDIVTRCLESSYPHAIQQLLEDNAQKVARIETKDITQLIMVYLSDLKKIQDPKSSATHQERVLATSLEEFISGEQNWEQLRAIQIAMQNYPEYRQNAFFNSLIDTIMASCVVATPLPQLYIPKKDVAISSQSIKSIEPDVAESQVEEIDEIDTVSVPQSTEVAEERRSPSPEYSAFMEILSKINAEKKNRKEGQHLNSLYMQRDALFESYMNTEFDIRGRKSSLYKIITLITKDQEEPLLELYYKLDNANPLQLRVFAFLIHPTWHKLEELKQALTDNPGYYQDETLDKLLSHLMTLLVQSVESLHPTAIEMLSSSQGHFTKRAIHENNQALIHTIEAYKKQELLSNTEQWTAIKTVGKLLLNTIELLVKQPGSPDYIALLNQLQRFVMTLTSPDNERQLTTADFDAIQKLVRSLSAPTSPIRLATEFILDTAQKTQEYKPKLVNSAQQTLRAKIESILYPKLSANNSQKWNKIFQLFLLISEYSDITQDDTEQTIFKTCMPFIEHLIELVGQRSENKELLEILLAEVEKLLAPIQSHPFKEGVQRILAIIKETDDYQALVNSPSEGSAPTA